MAEETFADSDFEEEALAEAAHKAAPNLSIGAGEVFREVWRAMQGAEEIEGPEEDDYIDLMDAIVAEATRRRDAKRGSHAPHISER